MIHDLTLQKDKGQRRKSSRKTWGETMPGFWDFPSGSHTGHVDVPSKELWHPGRTIYPETPLGPQCLECSLGAGNGGTWCLTHTREGKQTGSTGGEPCRPDAPMLTTVGKMHSSQGWPRVSFINRLWWEAELTPDRLGFIQKLLNKNSTLWARRRNREKRKWPVESWLVAHSLTTWKNVQMLSPSVNIWNTARMPMLRSWQRNVEMDMPYSISVASPSGSTNPLL